MSVIVRVLALVGLLAASAGAHGAPVTCRAPASPVKAATLEGARLTLCYEGRPGPCFRQDVAARGAWTSVPPARGPCGPARCPPPAPAPLAAFTQATRVTVCAPDGTGCRTVTTPPAPAGDLGLAVTPDRERLAVVQDAAVTLLETRSGRVLATIPVPPLPDRGLAFTFRGVRFLGDLVLIELGDGVQTFGRLVAAGTGATVAELADGASLDPAPPVLLGGEVAVATADGEALALHDVRTGAGSGTVPLLGPRRPGPAGLLLFAASGEPGTLVAVRGESDGAVAVFDAATRRVSVVPPPPACAPRPEPAPAHRPPGTGPPGPLDACVVDEDCALHFRTHVCFAADPIAVAKTRLTEAARRYPPRRSPCAMGGPDFERRSREEEGRYAARCARARCVVVERGPRQDPLQGSAPP